MARIFDLNNPVWVFMGKLVDMVILTGLWLLCCIPVVTAPASTKALYALSMQLAKNEEGYIVSSFFRKMKEGFLEGTVLGFAVCALGVFLASDLYVYHRMPGGLGTVLFAMFFVISAVYVLTLAYLYPLMAMTSHRGFRLVLVSFVTALKNPGWALLMALVMVCILLLGVFVMAPVLVVGIGLAAYVQCKIALLVTKHYHIYVKK